MSLILNLSKKYLFYLEFGFFLADTNAFLEMDGLFFDIEVLCNKRQLDYLVRKGRLLFGKLSPLKFFNSISLRYIQKIYNMPCVINRLYQLPFQQMLLVRGFFFPVGCELKYIPPVSYIKHPLGIWDQEPSDRYLAFTLSDEANVAASEHSCAVVKSVMPKSEPYSEHAKPFSV